MSCRLSLSPSNMSSYDLYLRLCHPLGSVQLVQTAGKHSFFKQPPTQSTFSWRNLGSLFLFVKGTLQIVKNIQRTILQILDPLCPAGPNKSNNQIHKEGQRQCVAW